MKIQKKDILFGGSMALIIIVLIMIVTSDKKKGLDINPTPSVSESPSNSPEPTPIPEAQNKKPRIVVEEIRTYKYWFDSLDPESRVIAVYNECEYLVPSNVSYKNNTLIMLDNTRSEQTHVIKIGDRDYTIAGGAWNTITLSSPTVPAKLPIFCKGIEMGQIDLL